MRIKQGIAIFISATLCLSGCVQSEPQKQDKSYKPAKDRLETKIQQEEGTLVNVKINDIVFEAVLYDNETTRQLQQQIPLQYTMQDLHRNEKYVYLDKSLPVQSTYIDMVQAGELMLFGTDCIVLFYKDFNTTFSYTKLGYIKDIDKLQEVVGSGDITFEIAM